jgi:hypothetical protein
VTFHLIGGVPQQIVGDWTKILGDGKSRDPHMIPSMTPRDGLPPPSDTRSDHGTDPIHGREWNTNKEDLQFACTFALETPVQCQADDAACDCANPEKNPPLCGDGFRQVRAKAYPSIRPLRLAQALGDRAVVSSICQTSYAAGLDTLADRMRDVLAK